MPEDVKRTLERAKGERGWGAFLLEIYKEADNAKRREAFNRLAEELSEEDLGSIARSSEEFREGLKFR